MNKKLTKRGIRQHFFDVTLWVDTENTRDVIFVGDPDKDVSKVGTGCFRCSQNLEPATTDEDGLRLPDEGVVAQMPWGGKGKERGMTCGKQRYARCWALNILS